MHGEDVRGTEAGVKLTWDDYALFPDDGQRHELIEGERYVTPAPVRKHQMIVVNIVTAIRSHLKQHPLGFVYVAPFDVILSNYDVVEPDVLYVSRERAQEIEMSPWVKGAPNLVVEVGSPGTRKRDETTKRLLYERYGVDEYWLVDTEIDAIAVLRRSGDRFEFAMELRRGDELLTTPLLPDWSLPLREVFEE